MVTPDELESWVLHHDDDLLVVNKPAHVVCHPSKHGPWSSLIGACRALLGCERLHMPSRLDRETSGVVVVAKTEAMTRRLHRAAVRRDISKTYLALLEGRLERPVVVDQPIGPAAGALVAARRAVVEDGVSASTEFVPLARGAALTLTRVVPRTGRMHQIRVHAAWLGHPVAGDKLYGPDERLFLEFLEHGWTERLERLLRIDRQALHAAEWSAPELHFTAPVPPEFTALLEASEGVDPGAPPC
jgi:23S rRNA pseudouridine1911/1915/1917 synthase